MRFLSIAVGLVLCVGCVESVEPMADASPPVSDAGTPPPPTDTGPPPPPVDAGPPPPRFAGLPDTCWLPPNSFCNPANNAGCESDEACDVAREPDGRLIVACFPPPSTQQLGETCRNDGGPFCAGGLKCVEGMCLDSCCTDAECTVEGERCIPLDDRFGSLGVCRTNVPTPSCSPPGGFCSGPSDCCSNSCHIDHCH